MPQSMRMVVDLPAPLGPRKPKISPRLTSKLTRLTATKLPKRFSRLSTTTADSRLAACVRRLHRERASARLCRARGESHVVRDCLASVRRWRSGSPSASQHRDEHVLQRRLDRTDLGGGRPASRGARRLALPSSSVVRADHVDAIAEQARPTRRETAAARRRPPAAARRCGFPGSCPASVA